MEVEFKIALKSGKGAEALALIVGYHKYFSNHQFTWSTGIHVNRKSFNPARPGRNLRDKLSVVEDALQSLLDGGEAINNTSLKARADLITTRFQWLPGELLIWSSKLERYKIPASLDRKLAELSLQQEMQKGQPDFETIIRGFAGHDSRSLLGFARDVSAGKIKPMRSGKKFRYDAATLGVKKRTTQLLEQFQLYDKQSVSFDTMDMHFYNRFTTWLEEEMDLEDNTIGKHIKDLKAILNLALNNELHENTKHTRWPVIYNQKEVITPSKDEFLSIAGLDLSGTIGECLDIFLLASFLGPRISDWKQFTPNALSKKGGVTVFEYVQEKTGQICRVPVRDMALAILDKRGGEFPRMISEQNFRTYVKDFCKIAADKNKSLRRRVITKVDENNKPVFELLYRTVSPHTARRIFATSLYYGWWGDPMPASYVMHYTGHKTEKAFRRYINANDKDVSERAMEYFGTMRIAK